MTEAKQAVIRRLQKGDDCEAATKKFAATADLIPEVMIIATLGDRTHQIPACPLSLKVLLEARGNPNIIDQRTAAPAIHAACWNGSVDAVRLLLDARAGIETMENRMKTPPLNTALAAGSAKVCLELLNRLADVQWKHHDGATPLHVATAWISSSHNSNMREPPVGEEPVAVISMMLHNGVDPDQTEGMSKSTTRSIGMTPLEAFRRDVAQSPWRNHEVIGEKFDKTAKLIHTLLEQASEAMSYKTLGNAAFKESRYSDALQAYSEARTIWGKADIRGHHIAVLWSNSAACFKKIGDAEQCKNASEKGLEHFCTTPIRFKLEASLKECEDGRVFERPVPPPAAPSKPASKLNCKDLLGTKDVSLYPPEGSEQGKVENPGPFICHFEDAREAGFVDGCPGWKDRQILEDRSLDEDLVKNGLMSCDLLDTSTPQLLMGRPERGYEPKGYFIKQPPPPKP